MTEQAELAVIRHDWAGMRPIFLWVLLLQPCLQSYYASLRYA